MTEVVNQADECLRLFPLCMDRNAACAKLMRELQSSLPVLNRITQRARSIRIIRRFEKDQHFFLSVCPHGCS